MKAYTKQTLSYWGNEVAEPLVCNLMADHKGDPLLGKHGRILLVDQQSCLSVGQQAPVFHGPFWDRAVGDQSG